MTAVIPAAYNQQLGIGPFGWRPDSRHSCDGAPPLLKQSPDGFGHQMLKCSVHNDCQSKASESPNLQNTINSLRAIEPNG
jgi:hypothetical protein